MAGWRGCRSPILPRSCSPQPDTLGSSTSSSSATVPCTTGMSPSIRSVRRQGCVGAVLRASVRHCRCWTGDRSRLGKRCFDCCTPRARCGSKYRLRSWTNTGRRLPVPISESLEPADWSSTTARIIAMLGSMSGTGPGPGRCKHSARFRTATRQPRSGASHNSSCGMPIKRSAGRPTPVGSMPGTHSSRTRRSRVPEWPDCGADSDSADVMPGNRSQTTTPRADTCRL